MDKFTNSRSQSSHSHRSGRDSDRSSGSRRGDVKCPQCRTRFSSQGDLEFHQMTIPFCSRTSQANNVDAIPRSRIENRRSTEHRPRQLSSSDARPVGDSGRSSSHRSGRDSDRSSGSRRGEVNCPQCKTLFRSQSDLEFHQMTTPFCSRSNNVDAIPRSRIESHRSTEHRSRQLSNSDARPGGDSGRSSSHRSGRDSDGSSGSRRGEVNCPQCRTRFRSRSDLEFHQMTIPFCSRSSQASNVDIIPKSRIESHRSTENRSGQASGSHHTESRKVIDKSKRKRHTCPQCQKSYTYKGSLDGHIRECHEVDETRFACPTCGITFSRKTVLRTHIREVHAAGVVYKCNHCSYTTVGTLKNVRVHIRLKHKITMGEGDFTKTRR